MAFTVTALQAGASAKSWNVAAGADADAFVDIPHGLAVIPKFVTINPLSTSDAISLANSLAGWSIDRVATNVRVRKSVQAGTAAGIALVVIPIPIQ